MPHLPAADNLKDNLSAGSVCETPMDCRTSFVSRHDMHPADSRHNLVNSAALSQYPRDELEIRHAGVTLQGIVTLIAPAVGEIEKAGRQTFLVHAIYHILGALDRQADVAVPRGEQHTVFLAARHIRTLGVAPGNDNIPALQITASPFYRTGSDSVAAFGT